MGHIESQVRGVGMFRRASVVIAPAVLAGVLLTGCSGGGGDATVADSSAGGGVAGLAEAPAQRDGLRAGGAADQAGEEAGGANRTTVQARAVVRTARIAVTAKDLEAARDRVDRMLFKVDGAIDHEETTHDRDGDVQRSTLVLRVPVDRFGEALDALENLGTLQSSDRRSEDVTTEVIDLDERVETLQNSLDRLQRLQRDSASLEDLLRFEQEITQRESELRSLEAQQSYLADQTSLSTITLNLSRPHELVPPPDPDEGGFLSGLTAGWNALKGLVVVALTVVGAMLPFVGLGLLVAVPVWLLVRSIVRRRPALATAGLTGTGAAGAGSGGSGAGSGGAAGTGSATSAGTPDPTPSSDPDA